MPTFLSRKISHLAGWEICPNSGVQELILNACHGKQFPVPLRLQHQISTQKYQNSIVATVFLIPRGAPNNLVQNNKSSSSRKILCCSTQLVQRLGAWQPYNVPGLLFAYSGTAQDRASRGWLMGKFQKTGVCTSPETQLAGLQSSQRYFCMEKGIENLSRWKGRILQRFQRSISKASSASWLTAFLCQAGKKRALLNHPEVNEGHCHPVTR